MFPSHMAAIHGFAIGDCPFMGLSPMLWFTMRWVQSHEGTVPGCFVNRNLTCPYLLYCKIDLQ